MSLPSSLRNVGTAIQQKGGIDLGPGKRSQPVEYRDIRFALLAIPNDRKSTCDCCGDNLLIGIFLAKAFDLAQIVVGGHSAANWRI